METARGDEQNFASPEYLTIKHLRESATTSRAVIEESADPALLRSAGPEETARLLVYLGRQAQQTAQGGLPRPGYRPKGTRARQVFLLQGLPGVGPERAARLLDRFGSVQAIMTASADALATVGGIGEKTAAKMRRILEASAADFGVGRMR